MLAIVIAAAPVSQTKASTGGEDVLQARELVETFLKEDFDNRDGDKDVRFDRTKYTPAQLAEERKEGPTGIQRRTARPVDIPFFYLVESWQIVKLELADNHGVAVAQFKGSIKGRYDKRAGRFHFRRESTPLTTQEVSLVREGRAWLLFYPPAPRISTGKYRAELAQGIARKERFYLEESAKAGNKVNSRSALKAVKDWINNRKADLEELDRAIGRGEAWDGS